MSIGTRSCKMLNKQTTKKSQPQKSDTPNSLSRTASNWKPSWCSSSKAQLICSIWGSRSSTLLDKRSTKRLTRSKFRPTLLKTQNARNTLRRCRRRWTHPKLTWLWSRARKCKLWRKNLKLRWTRGLRLGKTSTTRFFSATKMWRRKLRTSSALSSRSASELSMSSRGQALLSHQEAPCRWARCSRPRNWTHSREASSRDLPNPLANHQTTEMTPDEWSMKNIKLWTLIFEGLPASFSYQRKEKKILW